MASHVVFLLGKPPKPGTIIDLVRNLLDDQGVRTSIVLPHEADDSAVIEDYGWGDADLIVHRGLSVEVHPLLEGLHREGAILCNPWPGLQHTVERQHLHDVLVAAGIPCPGARSVPTWEQVLQMARVEPVVVKTAGGGRGSGVLAGHHLLEPPRKGAPELEDVPLERAIAESAHRPLPRSAPGPGPYLVEQLVLHDGIDRKLYIAGDHVTGLYKPSTLVRQHSADGVPFQLTRELREVALATAQALDLHLLGVDIILGPEGPQVVDVNAFPGYRSVPDAPRAVADHLLTHL